MVSSRDEMCKLAFQIFANRNCVLKEVRNFFAKRMNESMKMMEIDDDDKEEMIHFEFSRDVATLCVLDN
jgi:hypothetical protein